MSCPAELRGGPGGDAPAFGPSERRCTTTRDGESVARVNNPRRTGWR